MWQHNLKLTFRNFKKNKVSFLINLIGLSSGLACVLLIYLWVSDEYNVDKFHENGDRIYKVMQNFNLPQGISTWETTPILLAQTLAEKRPEVESAISICSEEEMPFGILSFGEKEVMAKGLYAGNNFFDFFSFKLIHGDKKYVLNKNENIVLSENIAKKLFGSTEKAMGQIVARDSSRIKQYYTVSGVFETPPKNSISSFDFVSNIQLLINGDEDAGKWNGDYGQTFLLLKKDTDPKSFNTHISDFMAPMGRDKNTYSLFAQKYSEKYLTGKYENGKAVDGRMIYVRLFSIIALFILLIGCINFINLSTAQATLKMKEIGVKKTIGATRSTIILQLLLEAMVMVFLALGVALFITLLFIPHFNEITNKNLQFVLNIKSIIVLFWILLFTGLISGGYAAFYISGLDPVIVLKGKLNNITNEHRLRKGLVVFQFSLTIIFIIGVFIIQNQMDFIQNKNLGFNRDHVLIFQRTNFRDRPEEFISELKNIPGVSNAGSMFGSILEGTNTQSGYSWSGNNSEKNYLFKSPIIGYEAIECLGIELLSGRTFSNKFKEEENKIIINESARKMMGFNNPIGKVIDYGSEQREIIGVINDFNYGSIHHQIEPLIFRFSKNYGNNILIKIKAGAEHTIIEKIKNTYAAFHTNTHSFDYTFLDSDYQKLYLAEQRITILSKYFSTLAIIISCLGLFGLAMFTIERRKKEIGIRKVMGASIAGIVHLLSKDFIQLVITSLIIATPIAWYFMDRWLNSFAYHVNLNWWVFAGAGLLAVAIAFLTVGLQSLKAALVNPVESIRGE